MAEATSALRKPVFTKVNELRPGTNGHSLNVKVVNTKMVMKRGGGGRPNGPQARQMRIAECLVGDETGIIIFTARNESALNAMNGVVFGFGLVHVCIFLLCIVFFVPLHVTKYDICF